MPDRSPGRRIAAGKDHGMNSRDADKLKHVLNTEVVRRMLIRYFVQKGFKESFDKTMHPSSMQDLLIALPQLASKVEVVPHAVEVDTSAGKAVLGWNLFVLGSQRMYLGETHHRSLPDLARQIQSGQITETESYSTSRRRVTPRQVVAFIVRVLGRHNSGFVDLVPPQQPVMQPTMAYGGGAGVQFYGRGGFGV